MKKLKYLLLLIISLVVITSCGKNNNDDDICEHSETISIVDKEATCTENGFKHLVCKLCGETVKKEIIAITPNSHDLVYHEGLDPTCTENGYEAYYTCTRCDYATYKEIEARHNYVNDECTRCGIKIIKDGDSYIYKLEVSSYTTSFNFKSNILEKKFKNYYLSNDKNGTNILLSKTVNLEKGNNIYYILCEKDNGDLDIYKVNIYRKEKYTLTFNTNGGTVIDPITAEYGTPLEIKTTRKGYEFVGWFKESSLSDSSYYELGSTMPNENLTLYAKWKINLEIFEISGTKYIYFGEYPQTLKETSVTITSDTTDDNGYYLGSDGERYAKVEATPYSGETMYFNNKTKITKGTTHYFKVEPIKWQILEESNGTYKLVSDLIIDNQIYYSSTNTRTIDGEIIYSNNYEYSDIRKWLNEEFLNQAFTTELKSYINTTHVDNSVSSTGYESNPYICNDTYDKVYLLSYSEMTNTNYGYTSNASRQKQLTDYAKAKGCLISTYDSYYNNGYYWLRSPNGGYDGRARYVNYGGSTIFYNWVDYGNLGVVAAITITI